jgi:hypothetical protein
MRPTSVENTNGVKRKEKNKLLMQELLINGGGAEIIGGNKNKQLIAMNS